MKSIKINSPTHGLFEVMVDDSDYVHLSKHNWSIRKIKGSQFYATKNRFHKGLVYKEDMHRLIMGFPKGLVVDHIDRNTINNQRNNLRLANRSQSQHNQGVSALNTTGYKGVTKTKSGKYLATIWLKDKKMEQHLFNTATEAAEKYNELALKYHGEFAFLNQIPSE